MKYTLLGIPTREMGRVKLYALGVPYTHINREMLALHSRSAVLQALRLYGGRYTSKALQHGTPYSRRQQSEALRELQQSNLISLDERGIPSVVDIPPHKLAEVPTGLEWDGFSLAELRVCIAVYVAARHQRAPYFTWEGTHDELAALAHVSRQAAGQALRSLAQKGILAMKALRDKGSRTTRGTLVRLLDQASGASLNELGWFFRNRLNELDTLSLYKLALKPQMDFHGFTADSGMRLACPLCLSPNRTFRVTVNAEDDRWACFACGRSGDSSKLCALRSFHLFKEPEFNLTKLRAYLGSDEKKENIPHDRS